MNYDTLPQGHQCIRTIDMKDPKLAIKLNLLGIPVYLALLVPMGFLVPPNTALPFRAAETAGSRDLLSDLLFLAIFMISSVGFVVLHELIHAMMFRAVAKAKPGFGFTGLVAYCNCETKYICRRHYYAIALAPLVLMTVLLAAVCAVVPQSWFWIPYLVLVLNAGGSAGDVWICGVMARLPADILMIDRGACMDIYSKQGGEGGV